MATHPMTDAVQTLPRVASEIGPVLREHASETETGRRLAAPAMAALREAGLFRMLLPRSLGGQEADPVTFAQTVEAVAREDSAAALGAPGQPRPLVGRSLPRGGRGGDLRRRAGRDDGRCVPPAGGGSLRSTAATASPAVGRSRARSTTRSGCS